VSASSFQLDRATPGTLGVGGVLSFETAAQALQAIVAALGQAPVSRIDLAGVQRADSAGLACMIAVLAEARRMGRPLAVDNLPAGMRALARVCEVDALVG
jgi:phospholipid transport system transporter-binding protein